jgi:heme-degrading monooxygenase HmoA
VFARTITLDSRPEFMDQGIAYIRDTVFPEVNTVPGCVGLSLVADRSTGRCIATSAWETEQAMRDSEAAVRPTRQRAADFLGGAPDVDLWEIAIMHRMHPTPEGACVRSSWLRGDPADMDDMLAVFRTATLPALEGFDGFCSASLLVNRAEGRSLATIAYDSRDALMATREKADELRARTASGMGGKVEDVREFDLVHAHLHAPELV